MAYRNYDDLSLAPTSENAGQTLSIDGPNVDLPDASYVKDAALTRDGADLVLDGPQGTITVEGYFSAAETPDLVAPGGETLTPELVNSFARSPAQYAQNAGMADESPVGSVDEITGEATVTHLDGSVEPITMGTEIYQGDVIETGTGGAVNIAFIDETSFAVSEEARLAIDEYVYDPATESGTQDFSVLKGVFVFTSGLIGRDDPDDVNIDTPSGSIGIRGTIIAGDVNAGEITVVEGAIVVRDLAGNEMTLATQFETAQFDPAGGEIHNLGQLPAAEMSQRFAGVVNVSPTLFSSINDAAAEQGQGPANPAPETPVDGPQDQPGENFDANGSVDQNNDGQVDGSVEGANGAAQEPVDGVKDAMPVDGEPVKMIGEPLLEPKPMLQPVNGTLGMNPMGAMTATAGMETLDGTMHMMNNMANRPGDKPHTMGGMTLLNTLADGTNDTDGVLPPPPPSTDGTQDPNTIVQPPSDTTPPVHIRTLVGGDINKLLNFNIAPDGSALFTGDNFFQVSSQQGFDYFFDLEFFDPGHNGDALDFFLKASTVSNLNAKFGSNWSFDPDHGHLMISDTGTASDGTIAIDIMAKDLAGNVTGFKTYNLNLFAPDNIEAASNTITSGSGSVILAQGNNDISGVSNAKIFYTDANDTATLLSGGGNTIHLGRGENSLQINDIGLNQNNTVFGGNQHDSFLLKRGLNDLYGMDGDDVFKIDMTSSANGEIGTAGYVVDGGHSSFKAGDQLRAWGQTNNVSELANYHHAIGDTGGYGDTLYFENASSIDFTSYDQDYFRGIERIDLTDASTATALLNLTYQDVLDMTDYKNTLIIRADDDTLNLSGFSGMNKVADNVAIDDDYDGTGSPPSFDVYSNGTVTLLIEQDGTGNSAASLSGLPA
ncbi:MAG: FecR domain-containing protein [Rhodospirillales bacterium]|nr:FecR domain-containing protein [Rhodospirillales bacterium]